MNWSSNSERKMQFLKFYLCLEILWLIFYIVSVSIAYGINVPDVTKGDVIRLDTHLITPLVVLTIAYSKRPFLWICPLFIFILFRESINVAEISYFSGLRAFNENAWGYTLFVVCYQTTLSIIAFFWYINKYRNHK